MSHYVMDLAGRTIFLLTYWEENVKSKKSLLINQLDLVRELRRERHYSISVAVHLGRAYGT